MTENVTKLPIKRETMEPSFAGWHPFESLHREIDRLFVILAWAFGGRSGDRYLLRNRHSGGH